MLDVRRLQLLCDLSRLGTIAAVAGLHAYTPSAVSQQLSVLEREAGTPLLERSGRRVALTAAGRLLAEHGDRVLAALEQADAALAALGAGLTGPLRIAAFPTAVRTLLPSALVALGREHPGLELSVAELDPAAVPAALRERRLDVGLVNHYELAPGAPDPEPGPGLAAVPLLDETVFIAFPERTAGGRAHGGTGRRAEAQARSRTQSQAAAPPGTEIEPLLAARDADWILASPGTLCHTATLHVCRAAGFTPRARHHADDFATVLALVAAGQGISLVPQLAAAQPPAGVHLVRLPVRRRNRIAYRQGAAAHPAVAAFVSRLRASAEDFQAAG
jgi:DNA-binding transcriptional LysR family regulator